ncbi:MAG: hypothetical protein OWQ51_10670 [Pyrobaculum arsenaticum]|uniref:Uncharacterized protein n=1 Tax=Pyrobaculum arsenaticum (strain DSM 13514 / JCM 11321 / PZ6) TaxID=340102 RepID=A4WMG2_PYRAR|nr:hypothetical protein [Pyrobaculum arsenaticum]ABP51579.1 conserved hypothetical protein [Pyrobaculum arsenaticum DSM 13514]MCY0891413.1 hypothetical protein [Pyrobaculum arsenaticum]
MERRVDKRLGLIAVLLGVAALLATVSVINVTYWYVNTTKPPVIKYVGNDTYVMNGTFVKANWYYDPNTGLNITRVYVTGVPGDIVNITNALRVCSNYNTDLKIRISDVLLLQDFTVTYQNGTTGSGAKLIRYMAVKFVQPTPPPADPIVIIKDGQPVDTTTDYVTLPPGTCAVLGVDLIIDTNAPYYKTLAGFQLNIEKVPK